MTPTHSNRPIVRTRNLSKQVSQGGFVLNHDSVNRSNMGRRLLSALLSIVITLLKFTVNMLTIGISFLTSKNLPLVEELFPQSDERTEAIERQEYVVEHSSYDSPIKY